MDPVAIVVQFLVNLVITAALLLLLSQLNLGVRARGFGVALAVAVVLAAFGALFHLATLPFDLGSESITNVVVSWVFAAFLLWLAGTFVPGFTVKSFGRALVGALVLALLWEGVQALVGLIA